MSLRASSQARDLLDRMVHEKEITAAFFIRLADSVEDVDQRRWFRRMGQDEKDQRKILIKHRRELWGRSPVGEGAVVSQVHEALANTPVVPGMDILQALRVAVMGVDKTRELCALTSDLVEDRSCRIFLKILSQDTDAHRRELVTALQRLERQKAEQVGELAA